MQPRPIPEILVAGISPTYDAAGGTEGIVPQEGNGGGTVFGKGPLPGALFYSISYFTYGSRSSVSDNFSQYLL